ncbi:hypothetical protein [Chryseobacterium vrystaatense]|uniref:Uncharacterized protein n=1 Tax=Chryseobacterium vrystaatense TaxID=307480 RepID=A0A1M5NR25_9FLAO|nr:hypothetical protein [Chryseobacterium vrystaatense]SHG92036.1 hypothetical protein SAMN02787073_5063 [Chryseobacterium vrystaatense]
MNAFIIKLALRICYFTASVIWGIMTFLQYEKKGSVKMTVYNSIQHFRDEFSLLNECQQRLDIATFRYDNFFIFFGGLLLVFYALKLKSEDWKDKPKSFWSPILTVLLVAGLVYMALDWSENYCFLKAVKDPGFDFLSFKALQLSKWATGLVALGGLILIDLVVFINWRRILWAIFGFLLITLLVAGSVGLYNHSYPICSACKK